MKKLIISILACLCAAVFCANSVAQTSTGGIYFYGSKCHGDMNKPDKLWMRCPLNPNFNDLYLKVGQGETIRVELESRPPENYSTIYSSSDPSIVKIEKDNRYVSCSYITALKVSDKPVIVKAKIGDMECTIRVFVYGEVTGFKMENDGGIRVYPEVPVLRNYEIYVDGKVSWPLGMESLSTKPKWKCTFRNGKYYPEAVKRAPGASYTLVFKMDNKKATLAKTDLLLAGDVKPGDYVVWDEKKNRYVAYDGGFRSTGRVDVSVSPLYRDKVMGVVAAVYEDSPFDDTPYLNYTGIYTSDGRKYHAMIIDIRDCDKKWVYSSENNKISASEWYISNYKSRSYIPRGYQLTHGLWLYNVNNKEKASRRIKPVYWIEERNKNVKGTYYFLPSPEEMEHVNFQAVQASLQQLIDSGRKDVQLIKTGSDYWTCEEASKDKAYAWRYDADTKKLKAVERSKQAELFVRAAYAL